MNKKDKWFSWGWLIFWTILGFELGIIYLIIKFGERG